MTLVLLTALGVGGATIIGALIGFAFKNMSHRFSDIILSFAAGVMLAAAVMGLIIPSVEYGMEYGKGIALLMTAAGIFVGALCLNLVDKIVPHLHRLAGVEIEGHKDTGLSKVLLFVMAIAMMSFTCDGISNIINMAQVADKPKKNIPLAWLIASAACALIYCLLGFVGSRLGSYETVAYANLGDLAQKVLPAGLFLFFIIGGAMASLSTALLGGVTGYAPLIQGIAQDGWLPKSLMDKKKVMLVMWVGAILPVLGGFSLDNIVAMIMVPGMVLGVIVNLRAMKLPEQYPEEWANTGLNISAGMYRLMMWVSIVASLLTGVFSLMSLTVPLMIGTVFATAFIFWYSNYCLKSGKVNITSTQDLG